MLSVRIRNIIIKLSNFVLKGKKYFEIGKEYDFIKKNMYKSIDHNLQLQKHRLYNLVSHAIKNVPYYKNLVNELDIKISRDSIFQDIKKFPILTKEIIRKNWDLMHVDLKQIKYIYNTSGGTTGEPLKFIQDIHYMMKADGARALFDEIGKYTRGDILFRLWGSERDIIKSSLGVKNNIFNWIKNITFLNSFRMSDAVMRTYVEVLNKKKSKVILAYIQSIYELAKFVRSRRIKVNPIKSIITSAGDLSEELREYLESTFKCRIYNRYGSREVSLIAMSCEKSSKLHINMHQKYIEILDNNNKEVKEHEKGNVIVTNLINYAMPLIRYKIGDIGSLDYSQCSCGRGFIRFDNVYGRIIDIFKNSKGELIYGDYFTHLFYFRENVKMFQVVQEEIDRIDINIVTFNNQPLDQSIETEIKENIEIVMGNDCKINFSYVSYINPSISGKYIYTISKINQ